MMSGRTSAMRLMGVLSVLLVLLQCQLHLVSAEPCDASIAVIGAGMAGLSTARHLIELGCRDVEVFEGLDRIGGRIHSIPYEDGYLQMGAQFINGDRNPIYKIAHRLNLIAGEVPDIGHFYGAEFYSGKCELDPEDLRIFKEFTDPLDTRYRTIADEDEVISRSHSMSDIYAEDYEDFLLRHNISMARRRVFDALSRSFRSYWEFEWASDWTDQSMRNLADWDDLGAIGVSYLTNRIGYKGIIDEVARIIPRERIHLSHRIANINYTDGAVRLTLHDGSRIDKRFDYVVVTVSLGHLKKYSASLFTPTLPRKKQEAIDVIGFGQSQKLYFRYEVPFWNASSDWFCLAPLPIDYCGDRARVDDFEAELTTLQPLDWDPKTLVAWIAGKGPLVTDEMDDDELAFRTTRLLRDMLSNQSIPYPSKIVRSKLSKNEMLLGAYSYVSKEQAKRKISHASLGMPLKINSHPVVLFAGEATHHRIFQTAVGAFLSGRREADRIFQDQKTAISFKEACEVVA